MLIRNWMTSEVISITPETSVSRAATLMKNHQIRRLPVIDNQMNVVGIVSDRDIKAASPSKATSLDMHELQYLLSELKVKEIMTIKPVCVSPNDSVEHVAMLMEEHGFGGLPVTENDKLAGIITDFDIFKVLLTITGARQGGIQLAFTLDSARGQMRAIFDTIAASGARVLSVLSHYADDNTTRHVFMRIKPIESQEKRDELIEVLKQKHKLDYWIG